MYDSFYLNFVYTVVHQLEPHVIKVCVDRPNQEASMFVLLEGDDNFVTCDIYTSHWNTGIGVFRTRCKPEYSLHSIYGPHGF